MKRRVLSCMALLVAMGMLAGCDLSTLLGLARPQPAKPGLQMVLQAEPLKEGESVSAAQLQAAKEIIETRAAAMGVSQVTVQVSDDGKITVVIAGVSDTEQVTEAIVARGFIELLDSGDTPLQEGSVVFTTLGGPPANEPQPTDTTVWPVVLTSDDLDADQVSVQFDSANLPQVAFSLKETGAKKFADFTSNNIGKYMPIALDKRVISSPMIQGAITGGSGAISNINLAEARALVVKLKSGALPVNLRLLESTVTEP
jgi:preprotein translocase subunit SecD